MHYPKSKGVSLPIRYDGQYRVDLNCGMVVQHRLFIYLLVEGNKIQKIGQTPSLADISISENVRFRKELERIDKNLSKEFYKAIGLAAHGVGVGSFVYLRRVIEKLIEQRFEFLLQED